MNEKPTTTPYDPGSIVFESPLAKYRRSPLLPAEGFIARLELLSIPPEYDMLYFHWTAHAVVQAVAVFGIEMVERRQADLDRLYFGRFINE